MELKNISDIEFSIITECHCGGNLTETKSKDIVECEDCGATYNRIHPDDIEEVDN